MRYTLFPRFTAFFLLSVLLLSIEPQAQVNESRTKRPAPFSPAVTVSPPDELLTEESSRPILTITCSESSADVFIDNIYYGTAPLRITSLTPGIHSVRIEKNNFYPRMFYVELEKTSSITADVRLRHTTGFVHLEAEPSDALFLIDGAHYTSGIHPIHTGHHLIEIKKFGYESWTGNIIVYDRMTSSVSAVLKTAEFTLSDFGVSRTKVNPDVQNTLGNIRFSFRAAAAGSARLEIRGTTENDVLWSYTFPPFTSWEQSVRWNGASAGGGKIPDGTYTAVLVPLPDNQEPYSAALPEPLHIAIDRTLRTPVLSYKNGTGAIGGIPSACIMPQGFFQAGISAGKTFAVSADAAAPWNISADAVGSPCDWLELGAAVLSGIEPEQEASVAITGNIKANIHAGNFYSAILLSASYKNSATFSAAVPLEYARNAFSFAAVPGITFNPDGSSWCYQLGSGIRAEWKQVAALLWAQVTAGENATETFAGGFSAVFPFVRSSTAVEIGTEWRLYKNGAITADVAAGYRIIL